MADWTEASITELAKILYLTSLADLADLQGIFLAVREKKDLTYCQKLIEIYYGSFDQKVKNNLERYIQVFHRCSDDFSKLNELKVWSLLFICFVLLEKLVKDCVAQSIEASIIDNSFTAFTGAVSRISKTSKINSRIQLFEVIKLIFLTGIQIIYIVSENIVPENSKAKRLKYEKKDLQIRSWFKNKNCNLSGDFQLSASVPEQLRKDFVAKVNDYEKAERLRIREWQGSIFQKQKIERIESPPPAIYKVVIPSPQDVNKELKRLYLEINRRKELDRELNSDNFAPPKKDDAKSKGSGNKQSGNKQLGEKQSGNLLFSKEKQDSNIKEAVKSDKKQEVKLSVVLEEEGKKLPKIDERPSYFKRKDERSKSKPRSRSRSADQQLSIEEDRIRVGQFRKANADENNNDEQPKKKKEKKKGCSIF